MSDLESTAPIRLTPIAPPIVLVSMCVAVATPMEDLLKLF